MAATRFDLPSLGADMDEGTLLEWRVKPGDLVRRGQVIAVVDTSKAAVDVEIWRDGRVQALLVEPGTKIPVGAAMMMVGDGRWPAGEPSAILKSKERHSHIAPAHGLTLMAVDYPAPEEYGQRAKRVTSRLIRGS